ncbi:MAG: helix-turn-helix domain-containing protein [Clostridiaceae bacterium]
MNGVKTLTTMEEIKAISDPYRMKIIKFFKEENKPLTVKEIADLMGEIPAKVHYHVKKLEKTGILHLTGTGEVNGIITKYYEPTAKSFQIKSEEISPDIKSLFLDETKRLIDSMYEDSKNLVFKELDKEEKGDEKNKEEKNDLSKTIRLDSLYLTEEEFREFNEYIDRFCKTYSNKKRKSSDKLEEYHSFNVLFKTWNK